MYTPLVMLRKVDFLMMFRKSDFRDCLYAERLDVVLWGGLLLTLMFSLVNLRSLVYVSAYFQCIA
jgi:hypothetical protein